MLFRNSHKIVAGLSVFVFLAASVSVVTYLVFQERAFIASPSLPRLTHRECVDFFSGDFEVKCFYYRTHEKGGFKLPLALIKQGARYRAGAASTERELMVYIPGGPGQGHMTSADEITFWVEWLDAHDQNYDLLLFDPRGTGESIPSATCDNYHAVAEPLLAEAVETEDELSRMNNMLLECLGIYTKALKRQFPMFDDAELYDVFATRNQSEDINGMVTSLGYQRAHLWGVSYGTRLALASSRFEVVKTLILDSFYPFNKGMASDWVEVYYDSFNTHQRLYSQYLEARDAQDEGVNGSFNELYRNVLQVLRSKPLKVEIERWHDEHKIAFTLTPERLLELSFSNLYSPYRYNDFYSGLAFVAETGSANAGFLGVLEYFVNNVLDESFSFLTYYAVECLDNQSQQITQKDVSFKVFPIYERYFYLGFKNTLCDKFSFSKGLDVQSMQLNNFNKPMLIFSGEYDSVTPSAWASDFSKKHTTVQHVTLRNSGHAQLRSQQCNWSALNNFIREQISGATFQCEVPPLWQ